MKIILMKISVGVLVLLCLTLWLIPASAVNAAGAVTVSISTPVNVVAGGKFTATANVTQVTAFNSYQIQINYDPTLIQIDDPTEGGAQGVTSGLIGTTIIPVDMWTFYPRGTPGAIRVVGHISGNQAVTGAGSLAQIHFKVLGSSGHSNLTPTNVPAALFNNNLFDNLSNVIPSVTWIGSNVNLVPSPQITTPSLTTGEVGIAYSQALAASGGALPYTWSIQSGTLPVGLTLNAVTGNITGTPGSAGGPTAITFKVTDSQIATATKDLSIAIIAAPSVATASLINGEVGVAYSQTLSATGGTLPYIWSIQSGTLPSGLTLNAATGIIAGTPDSAIGPTTITFKVMDSLNATATKDLSIATVVAPTVTMTALNDGEVGSAYSQKLAAIGGIQPCTWSIQSGTLPLGLTLNAVTGNITGIPGSAGQFIVTFGVTDSCVPPQTVSKALTLKIVLRGDATGEGAVNMGDVTKVERIILGLDPPTAGSDANNDGIIDMQDIIKIERIILGIDPG